MLIERASLAWMGLQEGDTFEVESYTGKKRTVRIAGTVHDQTQMVAGWVGRGYGYVTPETMLWLGLPDGFDELMFVVAGDTQDKATSPPLPKRCAKRSSAAAAPSTTPGSRPLAGIRRNRPSNR